ncbi:MAG: tripartite tricarboxylate transporter TctB family protein [Synergistaceae bacterium]|nr:tripartite tricarboxylate transporter TctB family protein [Synergistaceae bacterium]MBQ9404975.1 tripartite tricarboxylate transporter TctB family protein [Synergistaceae bacterium]
MSESLKDKLSGLVFLAFSIFVYAASYSIRTTKADSIGPQFFPRMVAIIMGILAIIQIFTAFTRDKDNKESGSKGFAFNWPLILSIALLIAYCYFLKEVGFIVLTTIYLFCQIYLLFPEGSFANKKLLLISIVASLAVPAGIYYLFYYGFQIFLPAGILG